jgi:hypothetical protein
MNSKLTWDDQISKICRNVFFTLKRLWTIHTNTNSSETGHIADCPTVPVLWCYFLQVLSKIAWTPETYEHISSYTKRVLGVLLDMYYSMRICCMINKIIKSGRSQYLFDGYNLVEWPATGHQKRREYAEFQGEVSLFIYFSFFLELEPQQTT